MLYFMIGYYIVLMIIAGWISFLGAPVSVCFAIFIYPTCLFAMYFFLRYKQLKARDAAQGKTAESTQWAIVQPAADMHQISLQIVSMVKSNNDGPAFTENFFEELDERLKANGMTLHCDMRGYIS